MNTATATMRMRTILQNGAAIAIAAAALAVTTAQARAIEAVETEKRETVAFEIPVIAIAEHGRSFMHRPGLTNTTTQLNR